MGGTEEWAGKHLEACSLRTAEGAQPGEWGDSGRYSRCPQKAGLPGQPEISLRKSV